MRNMDGIKQFVKIDYLNPETCRFYKTEGGFIGLKKNIGTDQEIDEGRVTLMRMFPSTSQDEFISVCNPEKKEVGVIQKLYDFHPDQVLLLENELSRRYFMPKILSVHSIKEEFGYLYWGAETSAGPKEFIMFDLSNNLVRLTPPSIMLIDVDGNRFLVEDPNDLGEKVLRHIDVWL